MNEIKLPVRKEKGQKYWHVISDDNIIVAMCYEQVHADAIVAAINDRERMRKAVIGLRNDLKTFEQLPLSWRETIRNILL